MSSYIEGQDVEDYLTSAMAEASLQQSTFYAALNIQEQPTPVIHWLAKRGLSDFIRTERHYDRVRMKVMKESPDFYDRLSQAYREKEAERLANDPKARSRQQAAMRKAAKREAESDRRMAESRRVYREWSDKINKALELYERWTLSDGTPLGSATKKQLIAEADRESAQAGGHIKNSRFYRSLASHLDGAQTVGDVIDIADAHRLREDVYAGGE